MEKGRRWSPWRALRDRPDVEFVLGRLPDRVGGAVLWPEEGYSIIAIDRRVRQDERTALLAHELVHLERGGGCESAGMPASWAAVVARDEGQVDDEVARRLVPLHELVELAQALADMELPLEAWDVAQQFRVPRRVAERAIVLATRHLPAAS